ncbi:MAG: phosphotransferase [candidate division KSB1 bacterium]|nr:phosphotransferase [candidate division KSB1 bacterium]
MAKGFSISGPQAVAVQPEWLKARLTEKRLFTDANGYRLETIEIRNVWESSKRTTILYDMIFSNGGEKRRQLYVGSLVPTGKLAKEQVAFEKHVTQRPKWGPAVTTLPEINLVLASFPSDRKMALLREEDVVRWLERHTNILPWKVADASAGTRLRCELDVLKYVPAKRFTTLCRVHHQNEHGNWQTFLLVAKQLNEPHKARQLCNSLKQLNRELVRVYERLQHEAPDLEPIPFIIPKAYGVLDSRSTAFIEFVPGENLKRLLPQLEIGSVFQRVGGLLAVFHRIEKRVRKHITFRNEVAEVRLALDTVIDALPELEKRLMHYYHEFRKFVFQDDAPKVLLHGSFRLNHIFLADDRLALLDLDSIRMGHPAYDLANFLSSLYYLEAQEKITADERMAITEAFLLGYARAAAHDLSPTSVLWFFEQPADQQAGVQVRDASAWRSGL